MVQMYSFKNFLKMLIFKKKISRQQKTTTQQHAVLKYMIRQDISHIMHSEKLLASKFYLELW